MVKETGDAFKDFFRDQIEYRKNDLVGDVEKVRRNFHEKLTHPPPGLTPEVKVLIPRSIAGEGGFGKVMVFSYVKKGKNFAAKIIRKNMAEDEFRKRMIIAEKDIMYALDHSYIVKLFCHFQDEKYLYFVMEFLQGGDLNSYLYSRGRFSEPSAQFYVAQISFAFEYLQTFSIAYRDLKPENVMLDNTGYIKIIDFGFAKVVSERTYTLCGTPDYIAPEILFNNGYTYYVDWWALGILTYELLEGNPPFTANKTVQLFHNIKEGQLKMPDHFSPEAKDFCSSLLNRQPSTRLCCSVAGVCELRKHPWFNDFDFLALFDRKVKAPVIPPKTNTELKEIDPSPFKIKIVEDPVFHDF